MSSLLIWWWFEPGFGSVKKLQWLSPKGQPSSFLLFGQAERSVRAGTSRSFLWFIVAESFREYLKQIIKLIQSRPRICGTHYLRKGFLGVFWLVFIAAPVLKAVTLDGWFRAWWWSRRRIVQLNKLDQISWKNTLLTFFDWNFLAIAVFCDELEKKRRLIPVRRERSLITTW